MAFEFRTRDESYTGPKVLPNSRAVMWQASVFVDHLPSSFATDQYHLYLGKDRYSHIPRYLIDVTLMIDNDKLLLTPTTADPATYNRVLSMDRITQDSIPLDGLDILLVYNYRQYQGTLCPIPDVMAESIQQHYTRKRRH
jgi:hypothetical protein